MKLDARALAAGETLETDVSIVGGGPAGLVLATELLKHSCDVILLESGGDRAESDILALNEGDVEGDKYAGLERTRHRQIGGTALLWNSRINGSAAAKYAPLDACDLDARSDRPLSGWPLAHDELVTHYERAQRVCGLGAFDYGPNRWTEAGAPPFALGGPLLVSRVYQLGTRDALITPLVAAIDRASNARLYSHATVVRLETRGAGREVSAAIVTSPAGAAWQVRARYFVLAGGAVENARLLLASGSGPAGLGNGEGWVGRCFMEHPRDTSLVLVPGEPDVIRQAAFYDSRRTSDGTFVLGRLALEADAARTADVMNVSVTLLPRPRPPCRRLDATLGALGLAPFVAKWLPRSTLGWSRRRDPARAFGAFTLLLNLEQEPHPENRLTLSGARDSLGVQRPVLHWRWRADDRSRLERLRSAIARELEEAGLGRVERRGSGALDPNAHHHAGTTRMSSSARHGVVDAHGRVHELDNVFVAGASVFPTSGFANPVLTIVALSLRLAGYLARAV